MSHWIILPNTLYFPKGEVSSINIVEDSWYFNPRFNRQKLVFHRASMKWYESEAKKKWGTGKIRYSTELPKVTGEVHVYDPTDKPMIGKLRKKYGTRLHLHESPNFIATRADLKEYYNKTKDNKIQQQHVFYNWQKKRINELVGVKSYDKQNRKKMPNTVKPPKLPGQSVSDTKFIAEAEKYIAKKYPHLRLGPTEGMMFPISRQSSLNWLNNFLKYRFKNFGMYQDYIDKGNPFLFHSTISPMLNVGLLDAQDVLDGVRKYKKKVSIASYEGFIRQLIGWREYVRFLYIHFREKMVKSNYLNGTRKLTKEWYTGKTGITPVDDAIKTGIKHGFLHHIPRLMIMCNFMNLTGMHPKEIYRWFMEFSCDSYEWVMIPNIFGMGTFADGGFMMRKPYISSSAYIFRSSNYSKRDSETDLEKKRGERWWVTWDKLYKQFLIRNKSKLKKVTYSFKH